MEWNGMEWNGMASYELPFEDGDTFGNVASTGELLDY